MISRDLKRCKEYYDERPTPVCPVFAVSGETSEASLRLSLGARSYQN